MTRSVLEADTLRCQRECLLYSVHDSSKTLPQPHRIPHPPVVIIPFSSTLILLSWAGTLYEPSRVVPALCIFCDLLSIQRHSKSIPPSHSVSPLFLHLTLCLSFIPPSHSLSLPHPSISLTVPSSFLHLTLRLSLDVLPSGGVLQAL